MTEEEARQVSRYIAQQLAPLLLPRMLREHPSAVRGIIQIGNNLQFDPQALLNMFSILK